jgi:hypothetical protein
VTEKGKENYMKEEREKDGRSEKRNRNEKCSLTCLLVSRNGVTLRII